MSMHQVEDMDNGESTHMDRTRFYALQAEELRHQERQTLDHVARYQALGVGLVAMCQVIYDSLIVDARFSHEDVLGILRAAVQGR